MSINEKYIGQHVVIRARDAGVHVGTLSAVESQPSGVAVCLRDARRVWKWSGAFTLSEVATSGIRPSGSRMSCVIPEMLVFCAIEILPTTAAARETFDATHE